jgi:pyruvate dehydrogenase (quinone)
VAHLTIPKDIQDWKSSDTVRSSANIEKHSADLLARSYPLPSRERLEEAAALINSGQRVAILAGRGCLRARDEVLGLAERAAAPIVKPLLGKAVVPDNSPYTTGGIGLLGTAPSQEVLHECDTLLIAGSSFPYMEFYPEAEGVHGIQIDIDPARIGLRYPVEIGLVGDCREVLAALLPLVEYKEDRGFLEKAQERMGKWRRVLEIRGTHGEKPMKPQVVTYNLNRLLSDNAIVSTDSGTISTWAARYIDIRGDMQFSLSGTLATMANGLPYSIAAAIAYPDRQVVCIVGDGGLSMLMAELATLAKYNLNVKVIVIKNNVLGQIKWEQMVFEGNPEFGVQLQPIDFAGVARSCGIAGYSVDDPAAITETLREAIAHRGPALVEAVVDPNEPPMPGHTTTEQALKFVEALARGQKDAAAILKTVFQDKVREVL